MILADLTDEKLVENIQDEEGDYRDDSINLLLNRHELLCMKMLNRYKHVISSGCQYQYDDLSSNLISIVYESSKSYKPGVSKYATWLANQVRYKCLNTIKDESKVIHLDKFVDEESFNHITESLSIEKKEGNEFKEQSDQTLKILSKFKDKRIFKIFKLRYFEGDTIMKWSDVGRKVGLCSQAVKNLHDKSLKLLRSKLESESFLDVV
tara:strand:- start:11330 stop:11953 length:624 start_codon:yes stop_codon:yes gene_type:complete